MHVSLNCLGLTGPFSIGRTRSAKSEIGRAKPQPNSYSMTSGNNMKCNGTSSFTQSQGSQLEEPPDDLTLFVALTPNQFNQLCSSKPVFPDPYIVAASAIVNQLTAVQRAYEFMNWRQDGRDPGNEGHVHQKKFAVCTLKITHLGYLALMENGTLEKGDGWNHYRDGNFRLNGPLFKERTVIHKGTNQVLFRIGDEFMEIVKIRV